MTIGINLPVGSLIELHTVAIFDIFHSPPGRITQDITLGLGNTQFRGTLLKFHRIASCVDRSIDQLTGYVE